MSIAALIAWVVTAAGGFVLLGKWIAHGGARSPRTSSFPPAVIFGHFLLAAAGLVVWIVYLVTDRALLTWVALALLVVVALLGFTMFARWIPGYRARAASGVPAHAGATASERGGSADPSQPAEQRLPVAVVAAHGLVAVATVVLVLLAALGIGGS
ncbi:hypothetical protein LWC35_31615 [Pseudonocardia kujensis]|uniref:hypothetical protein n=1 Tax=Pseudonocardia kujensis TaxID=1128675 RepID=UPI001E6435EA|nr:hypothetical protein [Pseudonocardia kujensis]MCE0767414.1 hypothetical protein [Pseudonocardia kujensis]